MNSESSESLVLISVPEVDADIKVAEIYREVSGEVLRLAVAATGGIVLLIKQQAGTPTEARFLMAAAFAFSISAALSLKHKYDSGEVIACLVKYVRLSRSGDARAEAAQEHYQKHLDKAVPLLLWVCFWFGLGLAMMLGYLWLLMDARPCKAT